MADHITQVAHEEGKSTPTPARQPGFLDRLDSALGLELAINVIDVEQPTVNQDSHGGQVVSSPLSTEMDAKPTGNLRPGFFGAKGSL